MKKFKTPKYKYVLMTVLTIFLVIVTILLKNLNFNKQSNSGIDIKNYKSSSETNIDTKQIFNGDESKIFWIGDSWIKGLKDSGVAKSSSDYFCCVGGTNAKDTTISKDSDTGETTITINHPTHSEYIMSTKVKDDVSAFVVEFGLNGPTLYEDTENLLKNLHTNFPNIPIYVVKTSYVGKNFRGDTTRTKEQEYNSNIKTYNANIEEWCKTNSYVTFIANSTEIINNDNYLLSVYCKNSTGDNHLKDVNVTPYNTYTLHQTDQYQIWYNCIIEGITGNNEKTYNVIGLIPESKDCANYNTEILQSFVDITKNSDDKQVTLILPEGTYYFATNKRNYRKNESNYSEYYIIMCNDNIKIIGQGEDKTILKPIYSPGENDEIVNQERTYDEIKNSEGTDKQEIISHDNSRMQQAEMFYFNSMRDDSSSTPTDCKYLTNADFSDFSIDFDEYKLVNDSGEEVFYNANTKKFTNKSGKDLNYDTQTYKGFIYNSAGKAFMINLYKDCDWTNVTVKNALATGFGMDCPINCTISNCTAYNCGSQAKEQNITNPPGASGFGIGIGHSEEENILIQNCTSNNNCNYGYFFEDQVRFSRKAYYKAQSAKGFVVSNCNASENGYDFGTTRGMDTTYQNCISNSPDVTKAFKFSNASRRIHITNFNTKNYFEDVDSSNKNYQAIKWALNNGISNGSGNKQFGGNEEASKGSVLLMLYRMSGYNQSGMIEDLKEISSYSNVDTNSDYADGIYWASPKNKNIITDDLSSTFNYSQVCTYKEFADYLYRYYSSLNQDDISNLDISKSIKWIENNNINSNAIDNGSIETMGLTRSQVVQMLYNYNNTKSITDITNKEENNTNETNTNNTNTTDTKNETKNNTNTTNTNSTTGTKNEEKNNINETNTNNTNTTDTKNETKNNTNTTNTNSTTGIKNEEKNNTNITNTNSTADTKNEEKNNTNETNTNNTKDTKNEEKNNVNKTNMNNTTDNKIEENSMPVENTKNNISNELKINTIKTKENNSNNKNQTNDTTIAKTKIPNTGIKKAIFIILLISISVAILFFIKYKNIGI